MSYELLVVRGRDKCQVIKEIEYRNWVQMYGSREEVHRKSLRDVSKGGMLYGMYIGPMVILDPS